MNLISHSCRVNIPWVGAGFRHLSARRFHHAAKPNPAIVSPHVLQMLKYGQPEESQNKSFKSCRRGVWGATPVCKGQDFRRHTLLAFGHYSAKLFAICQNQVHVLVKGQECTDQLSVVLDGHTDSPVDKLEHLGTPRHRLEQGDKKENNNVHALMTNELGLSTGQEIKSSRGTHRGTLHKLVGARTKQIDIKNRYGLIAQTNQPETGRGAQAIGNQEKKLEITNKERTMAAVKELRSEKRDTVVVSDVGAIAMSGPDGGNLGNLAKHCKGSVCCVVCGFLLVLERSS
jgi:hypothetical protein